MKKSNLGHSLRKHLDIGPDLALSELGHATAPECVRASCVP